jgi:hypothetical protein
MVSVGHSNKLHGSNYSYPRSDTPYPGAKVRQPLLDNTSTHSTHLPPVQYHKSVKPQEKKEHRYIPSFSFRSKLAAASLQTVGKVNNTFFDNS